MGPAVDLPPGAVPWDTGFELRASDGVRLRGALWQGGGRGLVVLLSGRTEFLEKMALPAAGLVARGFSVASVDWRGQGLSDRVAEPAIMGHVERFADYGLDLAALLSAPELAGRPVRLMLAHSMGGAIGLAGIYRRIIAPEAVILSAPMLGVQMSPAVKAAAYVTTQIAGLFGQKNRRPPFGDVDTPYVFTGFDGNVLTHDRAVFDWMVAALKQEPRLQLAMPSLNWFEQATFEMDWLAEQPPITPPCLFLKGDQEGVVDTDAIDAAADRFGSEIAAIPGARHEVLIETQSLRDQAWAAIDRFLDQQGI